LKKLMLLGLLGFGSTFLANASPIDCATLTTMAALQAAVSCATQNVLFFGFTYNPGDTGITAANVTAGVDSTNFAGLIQVGWSFGPAGGAAWATSGIQNPMNIGYSVRLCGPADVGVTCFTAATALQTFTAAKAQEFAAFGSASPFMTNNFTGNSSSLALPTDNASSADNTDQGSFATGNTSVNPVLSTSGNGGALFTIQDLIIETTAPEPGTMILLGGGLVMIGLNLKKFSRRK